MHESLAPVHLSHAVAQCPELDPPPSPKGSYTALSRFLRPLLLQGYPALPEVCIYFLPPFLSPQCTANRNWTFHLSPLWFFYISSISLLICSSHSHLRYGKVGKGGESRGGNNHCVFVISQVQKPLDPESSEFPLQQWMSLGSKSSRLNDFWQRENSRSGTDLFLLNASRFNQQIIGLIKRHPLLGQEPAKRHAD